MEATIRSIAITMTLAGANIYSGDYEDVEHMGHDMMGGGAMGHGTMFRMMFALMDADGDGTISLQEFQAAHERIFKAMDSNKDGLLTEEEMQAFMHGTRRSIPQR
jgi:hypothetical protein